MAYLDESGLQYYTQKLPTKFVKNTQTVNGKALSGNIVLKAADFAQAVTNEKDLAGLTYTEPRTNTISVVDKTVAAENITFSYGKALSEVLAKGSITSNPSNADLIALDDGTYKVNVSNTDRFPVRYGTLFITTAGATYKIFLMVGTTGGLWYRSAAFNDGTWYDDWKQALTPDSDIDSQKVSLPYGKYLNEVLAKGSITSNPSNDTELIGLDDGTYRVSVPDTSVLPVRYGSLFISTTGGAYKMFMLVGTDGSFWYRCAHKTDNTWYFSWVKSAPAGDIPAVTSATYTPTFTWTGESSGPTVTVNSCNYIMYGKMVQINCRFTITALNAPSSAKTLTISLPEGISAVTAGGILGELYHAGAENSTNYLIQCNNTGSLRVFVGTGYGAISSSLTAQSYGFSVIVFNNA